MVEGKATVFQMEQARDVIGQFMVIREGHDLPEHVKRRSTGLSRRDRAA